MHGEGISLKSTLNKGGDSVNLSTSRGQVSQKFSDVIGGRFSMNYATTTASPKDAQLQLLPNKGGHNLIGNLALLVSRVPCVTYIPLPMDGYVSIFNFKNHMRNGIMVIPHMNELINYIRETHHP